MRSKQAHDYSMHTFYMYKLQPSYDCKYTILIGGPAAERLSTVVAQSRGIGGVVVEVREMEYAIHWRSILCALRRGSNTSSCIDLRT